jgi:hypothetical protein
MLLYNIMSGKPPPLSPSLRDFTDLTQDAEVQRMLRQAQESHDASSGNTASEVAAITERPPEALDTQAIAANIDASAEASALAEQMKRMPVPSASAVSSVHDSAIKALDGTQFKGKIIEIGNQLKLLQTGKGGKPSFQEKGSGSRGRLINDLSELISMADCEMIRTSMFSFSKTYKNKTSDLFCSTAKNLLKTIQENPKTKAAGLMIPIGRPFIEAATAAASSHRAAVGDLMEETGDLIKLEKKQPVSTESLEARLAALRKGGKRKTRKYKKRRVKKSKTRKGKKSRKHKSKTYKKRKHRRGRKSRKH